MNSSIRKITLERDRTRYVLRTNIIDVAVKSWRDALFIAADSSGSSVCDSLAYEPHIGPSVIRASHLRR